MFQTLLRMEPENVAALTQLGIVYLIRQDLGSARETFKKALGLEPENSSARHHLALVHGAAGEPVKAKRELERLLLIDPDHRKARVDLGIFELGSGNAAGALAHFEQALAREPDHPKALYYKALALRETGDLATARELLTALAGRVESEYAAEAGFRLRETPPPRAGHTSGDT